MLGKPGKTIRRARKLRSEMSLPEVLLWRELRRRPDGFRFRRQHPAGHFSLDFYCAAARLCVEVDGEAHSFGNSPSHDMKREGILASHGVKTIRVPARAVFDDLDGVVRSITTAAKARLPLHQPAAGPPPQAKLGED